MLSFDWSNVFLLVLLVVLFFMAVRTLEPALRFIGHIGCIILLFLVLHPLFAVLYGVFAGWHVLGGAN